MSQSRPFVSVVSQGLKISYRETSLSFFVGYLANWKLEPLKFGQTAVVEQGRPTLTAGDRDINYEDSEQVIHIII